MRNCVRRNITQMLLIPFFFSLLSCNRSPEPTVLIEMSDWPDLIESITEMEGFRMGEPGHEQFIGSGWDIVEQDEAGRFFRWAIGDTVDITIPVTIPRDLTISIKWAPPPLESGQYQGFIARFNGQEIERSIIASHRFTEQKINVSEENVHIGYNQLSIIPSRKAVLEQDHRPLRFCVREIQWNRPPEKQLSGEDRRQIRTLRERTDQLSMIHVDAFNAIYIPVFLDVGSEIQGVAHHIGVGKTNPAPIHVVGLTAAGTSIELFSGEIPASQRSIDFSISVPRRIQSVSFISDVEGADGIGLSALEFKRPVNTAIGRSILLITIDGLRADDVDKADFPIPTIKRIREQGLWCTCAIAPAMGTQPFYASIFSGHYPHIHSVYNNDVTLSAAAPTLASELKSQGYYCIASVSNPTLSSSRITLDNGFHAFSSKDDVPPRAKEVSQKAIESMFSAANSEKPYFIWIQFGDISNDLTQPENLIKLYSGYLTSDDASVNDRMTRYVASANAIDTEILRILDAFEAMGNVDSLSVIIASDQSMQFAEPTGCSILGQDRIRVPWILTVPRMIPPSTTISLPVSLTDLFTVVRKIGTMDIHSSEDENIVRLLGHSRSEYGQVYCETGDIDTYAVFAWPFKLIRLSGTGIDADSSPSYCLYNIQDDCREGTNIHSEEIDRIHEIIANREQSIRTSALRYRPRKLQ